MRKKTQLIVGLIVAALCSAFAALPAFFSTAPGARLLSRIVSSETSRITLDGASFRWFGPQSIASARIVSPSQTIAAHNITSDASLFSLFVQSNLRHTNIEALKLTVDHWQAPQAADDRAIIGTFTIASVQLDYPEKDIRFNAENACIDYAPNAHLAIALSGESRSPEGRGTIALSAEMTYPLFSHTTPFALQCAIETLPTDILAAAVALTHPQYAELPKHLFGATLSLQASGNKNIDTIVVDAALQSPLLQGKMTPIFTDGLITLNKEAQVQGELSPKLVSLLQLDQYVTLHAPIAFSTTVSKLFLPASDMHQAAFDLDLHLGHGKLRFPSLEEHLYITEADLIFSTPHLAKELTSSLALEATRAQESHFTIHTKQTLKKPFAAYPILESIHTQVSRLPIIYAEKYSALPLVTYLGSHCSGEIQSKNERFHASLRTDFLKIPKAVFTLDKAIALQEPIDCTYIHPRWLTVDAQLKSARIPFEKSQNLTASMTATAKNIAFDPKLKLRNTTLKCSIDTLERIHAEMATKASYRDSKSPLYLGLYAPLAVDITAEANALTQTIPALHFSARSDELHCTGEAAYSDARWHTKKLSGRYAPSASVVNGFIMRTSDTLPIFQEVGAWDFVVSRLAIDNEGVYDAQLRASNSAFTLETQKHAYPSTLKESAIALSATPSAQTLSLKTTADAGSLSVDIGERVVAQGSNLPSKLLSTLLSPQKEAAYFIGDAFAFELNTGQGKLSLHSPLLRANVRFTESEHAYLLQSGTRLKWTLTPSVFPDTGRLALLEPTTVALAIDHAPIPKRPPFSLHEAQFDASASALFLLDKASDARFSLEELKGRFSQLSGDPLTMSLSSRIASPHKKQSGSLALQANLDRYLDTKGALSLAATKGTLHCELTQLPSVLFDLLITSDAGQKLTPSALFGPELSLTADAEMEKGSGPIRGSIHSPYFRAALDGHAAEGYLSLSRALDAELVLSDALSKALFESLSVHVRSAEKPLHLHIAPRGVRLPLANFDVRRATIPSARLQLGKLRVYDKGNPSRVGSLFELQRANQRPIELWFAPMDFSLGRGDLHIDRTEMLYDNNYQIATWGDVDLKRDYVDMTLGLTAQSLRAALGLELPENFVLQIPFRGPIDNVRLDEKAAAGKIALLIARQTGPKLNSPFGDFMGIIGELADDQRSVPPPKKPFPWD